MATPSKARFTIAGVAATPSFTGYDANLGEDLFLQLEQQPPLGVSTCLFTVPFKSEGAPDPVLSNSGVADPVSAVVTLTITSTPGVYAYLVRCQTNGGAVVKDENGVDDPGRNTFERIVVVRSPVNGVRKVIVAERYEYDQAAWVGALNEIVDAIAAIEAGTAEITGPITFQKDGTFTIQQTDPDPGDAPSPTLLAGQDAPTGDNANGPTFTVRPGRGGTAANTSGAFILELGNPESGTDSSAELSLRAGTVGEFLRARYENGRTVVRAPSGLALVFAQEDVGGEEAFQISGAGVYFLAPLSGAVCLKQISTPAPVAGTVTILWGTGSNQLLVQSGVVTIALSALAADQVCYLEIVHDGNAVNWSGAYLFPGGVAPVLTLTAGTKSVLHFLSNAGGSALRLVSFQTNLA
jgi:hypothetical protein